MAAIAYLKKLLGGEDPDATVDANIVKEKNAQIGDQVFVEGVQIYQDGNGAPVEQVSPLGYHVGWAGILFLNVSQMVGTGVFSTRRSKGILFYFSETDQKFSGQHLESARFGGPESIVLGVRSHHRRWYVGSFRAF
jgi:hypothetical protein